MSDKEVYDRDLQRRFAITVGHLEKVLSKVRMAEKTMKTADKVASRGDDPTKLILYAMEKLKSARDFSNLMTSADLSFMRDAVERRLPDQRTASEKTLEEKYFTKE